MWIFNNVDTSFLMNPSYKFPHSGSFSVEQRVYNLKGDGSNTKNSVVQVSAYDTLQKIGADTLFVANYHSNYQWRLNGGLIQGANSNMYKALFPGNYFVEYTDSLGCRYTSDTLTVLLTSTKMPYSEESFQLYPNPTNNELYLEGLTIGDQLTVYSITGKVIIETYTIRSEKDQIDVSGLSNGMYLLKTNRSQKLFQKL